MIRICFVSQIGMHPSLSHLPPLPTTENFRPGTSCRLTSRPGFAAARATLQCVKSHVSLTALLSRYLPLPPADVLISDPPHRLLRPPAVIRDDLRLFERRFVVGKLHSLITRYAVTVFNMKKVTGHGATTTKAEQRSCARLPTKPRRRVHVAKCQKQAFFTNSI